MEGIMTVKELINRLNELSNDGKGEYEVLCEDISLDNRIKICDMYEEINLTW